MEKTHESRIDNANSPPKHLINFFKSDVFSSFLPSSRVAQMLYSINNRKNQEGLNEK